MKKLKKKKNIYQKLRTGEFESYLPDIYEYFDDINLQ